jgi:predicted DNA-binding transcriptional regulator YafY
LEDIVDTVSTRLRTEEGVEKGISKRSVQYDLQSMKRPRPEGFEAPIICNQGYYSYSEPDFSIYNLPIANDDLSKLKQAIDVLEQIKGLHFFEELEPIINNLSRRIESNIDRAYRIIEFEHRPEAKGEDYLGDIYKAILHKRTLKVVYKPFNAAAISSSIIHPYLLKEYNSRWFLLGWDEKMEMIRNLALDRIDDIRVAGNTYIENRFIDFNDYFKNIIGVTIPADSKVETIEIKVKNERAPYIATKPIHLTQQQKRVTKLHTYFTFELIPNKELISLFMSFGDDLEVISPELLRGKLKDIYHRASKIYESEIELE